MQTFLTLDSDTKQLSLYAKKRFEHTSDVCLKVRGVLNTVTAKNQVEGSLTKFMRLGSAPRYSEDDVYRPDQRLRLGLGARTSSTSDDVLLTVTAKQKVRLAKGTDVVRGRQVLRSYTQAAFKARYDYNVRTESWSGEAVAAVSHAMFRFSDDQDLRLTAGCRVPLTARGAGEPHPFVRLEENSWSVTADTKGGWKMMYAL